MAETDSSLFNNLRGLITLIDQLRDIGVSDYISLPRIAVLGTDFFIPVERCRKKREILQLL